MGRDVSVRTWKFLGRTLAYACLCSMGIGTSFGANELLVSERTALGDAESTWIREGSRSPAQAPSLAWKVSVAAFVAMQAADTATSYGYPEANALYGARFGTRGVAIKALIAVAVPLVERRIVRRHPNLERAFTAANLGVAGATARAVVYNARDIASKTAPAPITITPGIGTVTHP